MLTSLILYTSLSVFGVRFWAEEIPVWAARVHSWGIVSGRKRGNSAAPTDSYFAFSVSLHWSSISSIWRFDGHVSCKWITEQLTACVVVRITCSIFKALPHKDSWRMIQWKAVSSPVTFSSFIFSRIHPSKPVLWPHIAGAPSVQQVYPKANQIHLYIWTPLQEILCQALIVIPTTLLLRTGLSPLNRWKLTAGRCQKYQCSHSQPGSMR